MTEVIIWVKALERVSEQTAIAECSRYLTRGDHSDTFDHADINRVVKLGNKIRFSIDAMFYDEEFRQFFLDEMELLTAVTHVEIND